MFASTPLIDINDVQRKSGAFIGFLLLLMILLSILGIVAQATFAWTEAGSTGNLVAPADPRCGGADRGLRASAAERGPVSYVM